MESEVESLRQRVEQLERLVKGEGGDGGSLHPSQCGAQGPTLRHMPEYDQVWGILVFSSSRESKSNNSMVV